MLDHLYRPLQQPGNAQAQDDAYDRLDMCEDIQGAVLTLQYTVF